MAKIATPKNLVILLLGLLFNLLGSNQVRAVIYDFNVSLSDSFDPGTTGTLIGTIETVAGNNASGLGDYASGDFT